jgi:hypothetical protein
MRDRQNTPGIGNVSPEAVHGHRQKEGMFIEIKELYPNWRFLTRLIRLSMVRAVSAGGRAAIAARPRMSEA